MKTHGREILLAFAAGILAALVAPQSTAVEPGKGERLADTEPSARAAMRGDAQLADVTFVGEQGWAVGDRGAIWHTNDAGEHWQAQSSGVDCRLQSVHFLDDQRGWAVGGWTQPHTLVSRGVLLSTRDGGRHWQQDAKILLPSLRFIKFVDAARGWAIAEPTALFPSGVFSTQDGGRTWSALPTGDGQAWLTGDFIDPLTGALAGRNAAIAIVRRKAIEPVRFADSGLRSRRRMRLSDDGAGWLIGDGGLALHSDDQGATWQMPGSPLPALARQRLDFRALAVLDSHCWIAGSPGSVILHSGDHGRSWSMHATGQTLAIQAMAFSDAKSGCAVGDLGTILATRDGGRTWRVARSGGKRAALVGFFGQPNQLPLELIASLSGEQGYLAAYELIAREVADAHREGPESDRAHEAAVRLGAGSAQTAWRFPIGAGDLQTSAEKIIAGWDRANDGGGLAQLEAHLVTQIRTWRPDVVITSSGESTDGSATADEPLVNHFVLKAAEAAGDAAEFPELAELGLSPWKVKKVYAALPGGQHGAITLNVSSIAPRLGASLAELAGDARGLLGNDATPPPGATRSYKLLVDHVPRQMGERDFFSGLALVPGGDARRQLAEVRDHQLAALQRSTQARQNMQSILAAAESTQADGRYLAALGQTTRALRENDAVEVMYTLAERYASRGDPELAAEAFSSIAERYPKHPRAQAALVWLVQYYASGEAGWYAKQKSTFEFFNGFGRPDDQPPGNEKARLVTPSTVEQATHVEPAERSRASLATLRGEESRFDKAAAIAGKLERVDGLLFAEPRVQFPLAVAQRNRGNRRQAERFHAGMRGHRFHDAWWSCAAGEQWLTLPEGQPPKAIWPCRRAAVKPRLDGRLDDTVWRAAAPVDLKSDAGADAEWPSVALLAYDDEYFYVGLNCRRAAGFDYQPATAMRKRDANISSEDRVELFIDVDRDFTSWYRLAIDHRGFTREDCCGNVPWNPQWFVARGSTDDGWGAEAAIPWTALVPQAPQAKTVWAINVSRLVPGVGFQAWSKPASSTAAIGEGFGYLVFE